jgi:hypothetical protein
MPSLQTSGSGASLGLSPYSSALPSLPSQCVFAAALQCGVLSPSQSGASPRYSRGLHQSLMRSSFALPPLFRFYRLSCDPRPVGSLLSFERGNVATPIRAITARHSLSPTSSTRSPNSLSYDQPALTGGTTGLPRSTQMTKRVRCQLFPGGSTSSLGHSVKPRPVHTPFWLLPISIFGSFTVTRFITDSHTFTLPLSLASYRVRNGSLTSYSVFLAGKVTSVCQRIELTRSE